MLGICVGLVVCNVLLLAVVKGLISFRFAFLPSPEGSVRLGVHRVPSSVTFSIEGCLVDKFKSGRMYGMYVHTSVST